MRRPDGSGPYAVTTPSPVPVVASAARSEEGRRSAGPGASDRRHRSEESDLAALGGLVRTSSASRAPDTQGGDGGDDGGSGRRRRRAAWPIAAAVLVLALLAGGFLVTRDYWAVAFPPDFDGPGTGHVVVEVAEGSTVSDIGNTLLASGVVASVRGFGQAAEDDPRGRGIQPGFYDMQREMPASDAVTRLLDPTSRLGRMDLRGGIQVDDTAGPDGTVVPGTLEMIAQATCAITDAGERTCVAADDLRATMATTDPQELGVPEWAVPAVLAAPPERRLEGLVAPGTYDVRPGADAAEALSTVLATSIPRLESSGLVEESAALGVSPYEALIIASIAEREGIESDFPLVTRVIYNRLPFPMRLQMDSTINYPLDRQTLLTTPGDRATPGPYNTYLNLGLPPTPIGAASAPALQAALEPADGPWVYFVKCELDGTSCFAPNLAEHDENRRLAQARGVY